MPSLPQDVYGRNLISQCGYPLRTPEPNIELPESYQREGFKIGDVGVVVPEDGSFDVFFNICLSPNHQLHVTNGVPDNFTQIPLSADDYKTVFDAEGPGRIFSTSSVKWTVNHVDPFEVAGRPRRLTDYLFNLSPNEGAVLILPQGADRHRLAKELLFLDYVIQHAVGWYQFARQRLYRNIPNGSLYLITGFHKARSWALASFEHSAEFQARCEVVQLEKGGPFVPVVSAWEPTGPLDWRIGPRNYIGNPNQTVFISGFKIAVNEELLHWKRVTVKAENPQRTLATRLVGFGSTVASFLLPVGESEIIETPETDSQKINQTPQSRLSQSPMNDLLVPQPEGTHYHTSRPKEIRLPLTLEPLLKDRERKSVAQPPKKRKRALPAMPFMTFNPRLTHIPSGRQGPPVLSPDFAGSSTSEASTSSFGQHSTESPTSIYTSLPTADVDDHLVTLKHTVSLPPDTEADLTVQQIPSTWHITHPSDIIHHYLFKKNPSARIAIVHDNVWITLLEKGLLRPEELFQEKRLEEVLSCNFETVVRQGAVYLQSDG